MLEVMPVAITTVDWQRYLQIYKSATGRNAAQNLDDRGIKPGNLGTFICCLADMNLPGANPTEILQSAGSLLDHAHCAFGLIATVSITHLLIRESRLAFTTSESKFGDFLFSIVSGTLAQWRTAIINLNYAPIECRLFMNKVMAIFDQNGLKPVFAEYSRVSQTDGTFLLK